MQTQPTNKKLVPRNIIPVVLAILVIIIGFVTREFVQAGLVVLAIVAIWVFFIKPSSESNDGL